MSLFNDPQSLQLKMILDNMDVAVCLVDKTGKLVFWNSIYLKMCKCQDKEFESRYGNMHNVVNSGRLDRSFSLETLKTGKRTEGCQVLYDIHGVPQYNYATHLPIFGANGEVAYSLGIIQNVDKLKHDYFTAIDTLDKAVGGSLYRSAETDDEIVHVSPQMTKLIYYMKNIAATDATVLLLGESGTGKDLFARFIHDNSDRASKKMISVNCASIPADLFESELFGYESGAFTGANKVGKRGLIEEADGGTLFLDEINSMPMHLQSKLLRTIEQKTIQKVGSSQTKKINFRLIAATNADLMDCVHNNTFRLDLYFRLNVVSLNLPPLRERVEDIPPLVSKFVAHYEKKYRREKAFSEKALDQLMAYDWPGNVRELKNMIERIFLISNPSEVVVNNIADFFFQGNESAAQKVKLNKRDVPYLIEGLTFEENMEYYERRILKEALERYKTPKVVEEQLGMSHATIFRKLNKYNLKRYYK